MNEFRGKIPVFEPISEQFKKPDHHFYEKDELLHFKKPFKEFVYVPPKPVTPIFKHKAEEVEELQGTEHPESSANLHEYDEEDEDEYEESEGFGECEYEEDEDELEEIEASVSEAEVSEKEEVPNNFGTPASLAELCIKSIAENFPTMWKYVKYIPEKYVKLLGELMDLEKTDVGMAARAIHEEHFWKRWTNQRWLGYHKPWAHGGSWKIYFLQKYFAEVIAGTDPARFKIRDLLRLTRRVKRWIYALEIRQLSATQWPVAVDVNSGTESTAGSVKSLVSDMTLSEYLIRHINFFPAAVSTNRLELEPILRQLQHLTHLTLCFGFDNYRLHRDMKFSIVTDEDALNLSQALAACASLYCFKLSRSKVTPRQLETICFGLNDLAFFREADFSNMFLTDEHMVAVAGLLLMKTNMKVLSLKNNDIGPEGFIRLLHVIILKDCCLRVLNVSMNPIGDSGGVAMTSLLAKKKRFLKRVIMSGTGLTYVSGYNFGVVLYFNKRLEVLDLSVNQFNDFAAEALLKGMEHNYTLKRIDLRECNIPFTTLREMERLCFRNAELATRKTYHYPVVHPKDFWSGFNDLDAELPDELKAEKSEQELAEDEEQVTKELMQIFAWATAQMKPRNRFVLVRDIHAIMKKTNFVTGFNPVVEKLILTKQKELIYKARIDSKREKEERIEGSGVAVDFSMQDFMKKSVEKLKADFLELEALNVLKDVNRCGRIDELFKTVKSERIDGILKNIGRTLDADTEILSSVGISLPFSRRRYRGFPDPEPEDEEVDGVEEEDEEVEDEEEEEVGGEEEYTNRKSQVWNKTDPVKSEATPAQLRVSGQRAKSTVSVMGSQFQNDAAFQAARDRALNIRMKYKGWPKEGPPKFPKVIPYEIVKDCNEDLPDTEDEKEDDFPYWLDQWIEKQ